MKKINNMISIIIPTYNSCNYLIECLDSILIQTYKNYEIIIIDDCSNDGTELIIKDKYNSEKRIIYHKNNKNLGPGLSRKKGYSMSHGEYIIFCDSDDLYIDKNFFKDSIKIFNDNKVTCILSNTYFWYQKEDRCVLHELNFDSNLSTTDYLKDIQFKLTKPASSFSTVFRKSILEENNIKDTDILDDSIIYMRSLIKKGNLFVNKNIVGKYRIHDNNISGNIPVNLTIGILEEKKKIYKIIKEKKFFNDYDKWYEKHIHLTSRYYLCKPNSKLKERLKVYFWIIKNYKYGFILSLKLIIKHFLKK